MNVSPQFSLFQSFQQHSNLYDAGLTDNKLNDSMVISNPILMKVSTIKCTLSNILIFGQTHVLHSSLNDIQFRPVNGNQ